MSEERLTVAELLARQGKEAAPKEGGRRRRRRSLDEGGISVADLTGGQPRLRESGPRRGAHSHSLGESEEAEEQQPQEVPVAEEAPKAEQEREYEPAPIPEPEPEPEPVPEPRRQVTVADHAKHAGVPLATPVSPAPVMENPETGEMTFTFTALHDAETASQAVAQPGPMAEEARGVFSGVASVAPAPSVRKPEPKPDPKPKPEPEPEVVSIARSQEPAPGDARTDVQEVIRDEEFGDDADVTRTGVIPVVPDSAEERDDARAAAADDRAESEKESERRERKDRKERERAGKRAAREEHSGIHEDNSLSIPVLIVQVFVGLMVGAGLFLAFVLVWASTLPFVVKALIAVVVTALMVVGANAVRRPRDTLTPWLTLIVGILLTFGPYVITLF